MTCFQLLLPLLLLPLLLPGAGRAQGRTWELGLAGGFVLNAPTSLRIVQEGFAPLHWRAVYRTAPFQPPVYYDIRLSSWRHGRGWELKFTHHKLILDNRPPEIARFSMTDGFNLLTLNRAWPCQGFHLSAGMGLVITHPESTIRQQPYPENKGFLRKGYYISGPTLELAVAKRYYFAPRWFVLGEGRATASYVQVPVAGGYAEVFNVAWHGLAGLGFRLTPPQLP